MTSRNTPGNIYYAEYLQVKELLELQEPLSAAHDETLFIINHQTHELWFKQMIHELDSIISLLKMDNVPEPEVQQAVHRLKRFTLIQQALIDQIKILETMTPMDFLEFRDILSPASGFQSLQFRLLQIKLGSPSFKRFMTDKMFNTRLRADDKKKLAEIVEEPSLFDLIEKWLERMPFTSLESFDYWKIFKEHMSSLIEHDKQVIEENPTLNPDEKKTEIDNLVSSEEMFSVLFDKNKFDKLIESGEKRLSRKATLSALFILLNRDLPLLHAPFQLLTTLVDIDQLFYSWRQGHALLAQRMLGTKIGTGGSSGHHYLKNSAEKGRIFADFADLSTFLIPRSRLPKLPSSLKKQMTFYYDEGR